MSEEFYGKGITVASGFDLSAKSPLDTRSIVNTIEERNAHVTGNRVYEGMRVYVLAEKKEYRYNGNDWEEVGGITDEQLEKLTIAYEHSQTPHVTEEYVDAKIAEASLNGEVDLSNYATKTDLNSKVDKMEGKGLSTNDYTDEEKNKLNSIEEGANNYIHPTEHEASMIIEDVEHRFVTDEEKNRWNNKSDFDGDYNNLTNKPNIPTKTSQLTNDSGFLTSVPSEYVTETELESKGYLTEHQSLSNYATKDELHNHDNKAVLDGITANKVTSWDNKSDFDGDYNSLTNKPTIPSKTSELVNDSTYVTESGVLEIVENSGLGGTTEVSQGETEPTEESVLLWIDTTSNEDMVENNLSDSLKAEIQDSISTLNNRVSTLEKNIEPPFGEDAHTHSNKVVLDKITQAYFDKWNNKSDFNGSYNSLTDKPTIPTRTSELTNDTNYVTSSSIPTSLPANGGNADTVSGYTIWIGTQAEYDAISSKNSTTIYFIKG